MSETSAVPVSRRQVLKAGGLAAAWLLVPAPARAFALSGEGPVAAPSPAPGGSLPAWFGASRVQGSTRLSFGKWHETPEFTQAAAGFKALGAGAFTRHVKSGDEDPWWPSADGRNVAQEMIDEAHAQGLKIVTYYWHMSEKTFEDPAHAGWDCEWPDEDAIVGPRGVHLDITGPYREVVLARLLEMAEMGVDGLHFDYRHLPPAGCWGSALEAAWVAETGLPAPTVIDDADPRYREFIDFKAAKIEETFAYWSDQVKARHPHVVFVISTTTIPALTDREMTTRLVRIADCAKNEYLLAANDALSKHVFDDPTLAVPAIHLRQAVGWTVLRDAADGRPPHIWAAGMPDSNHARAFAGSLLSFGCIAAMDVAEESVLGRVEAPVGKTPLKALRAAFAMGDAVSPYLADTQPLRWAAVHFGEANRNAHGANYRAAWREVLWPMVGAFGVLSEDGLPVGIVNDHQLEHCALDGYHVLFLSRPDDLTYGQRHSVRMFAANGGVVIGNNPAWAWSEPGGTAAAAAAFRAALRSHVTTAPAFVTGGPRARYAVSYRTRSRLMVAVTNDFSWVQITAKGDELPVVNPPAPTATGVRVNWRRGHGLPEGSPFWPGRLQAVEAVTGQTLTVRNVMGGYGVDLPPFSFMALLVVTDGE